MPSLAGVTVAGLCEWVLTPLTCMRCPNLSSIVFMRSAMSLIILAVRAGPETKPTSQQLHVTDVHNAVASNRQCLHFYFQHSRGSDPLSKGSNDKDKLHHRRKTGPPDFPFYCRTVGRCSGTETKYATLRNRNKHNTRNEKRLRKKLRLCSLCSANL